jgi:nucleoside-diphosphate-sugar epimerase
MTTLITGAFGCIGAWVIRGLLAAGERPVVFDLDDDPWRVRMIAGPDAPAASPVPLCRQDPPRGATINVTGTANVSKVARTFLAAAGARLDRARVYNLHGASASVADVVRTIETAWPTARGLVTHVEQPIPFPDVLDDTRYRKDLGPAPATSLGAVVRQTLDEFSRLQQSGRLDFRELT